MVDILGKLNGLIDECNIPQDDSSFDCEFDYLPLPIKIEEIRKLQIEKLAEENLKQVILINKEEYNE